MKAGMESNAIEPLTLELIAQPDDTSCGPTCLQAVYRYFGEKVPLPSLMEDVTTFDTGGTLAVHLGIDALRRGYKARLYSYNLRIMDPTWIELDREAKIRKLEKRESVTTDPKRAHTTQAYIEFLTLGGEISMADLNSALLRKYLRMGVPILTGLSATYLYQSMREDPITSEYNDVSGEPCGHFVVLTGYDNEAREAQVADPYEKNPLRRGLKYSVKLERLVTAILLGVLTYDANLLIIRPKHWSEETHNPQHIQHLASA